MLKSGILNPRLNSLLSKVRHTNTFVIADRGFPFWQQIETIDISLVDDVPTVLQVLSAVSANFVIGKAWMADEFREYNSRALVAEYCKVLPIITFEGHEEFKLRIPSAIGLIRTSCTAQYSNIVLESA
jgi:D-ribose pyranase